MKDVLFIDGIVDRKICDLIDDNRNIHIEYLYMSKKHYYLMQITYC